MLHPIRPWISCFSKHICRGRFKSSIWEISSQNIKVKHFEHIFLSGPFQVPFLKDTQRHVPKWRNVLQQSVSLGKEEVIGVACLGGGGRPTPPHGGPSKPQWPLPLYGRQSPVLHWCPLQTLSDSSIDTCFNKSYCPQQSDVGGILLPSRKLKL